METTVPHPAVNSILPDFQEEERLTDLYSFGILDTEPEEDFTQLVELAANITQCSIAAISFIDKDRQWFKATKNLSFKETPRDQAFCHYTIQQDDVMLVLDAAEDPRFNSNLFVKEEPHISFYAGAPIFSSTGKKLGSVCVLDWVKGHMLSSTQIDALRIIANQVSRLLELRRKNKSLIDYTNKLIDAEKALHQHAIWEEEREKSFIAHQLHENFAQTLAATKLYIEFAENDKNLAPDFLAKSRVNIENIIEEIRLLCNYIRPIDQFQANPALLIEELVDQWTNNNGIDLELNLSMNEKIPTATGLHIYRLLQTLLPLTRTYKSTKANIQLVQFEEDIHIKLSYLPTSNYIIDPNKLLLLKKSISLTQAEGGTLQLNKTAEGIHQIDISLPLPVPLHYAM